MSKSKPRRFGRVSVPERGLGVLTPLDCVTPLRMYWDVRMYDTLNGSLVKELSGGWSTSDRARFFNIRNGKAPGPPPDISALAISPDGKILLAGDTGLGLRAWNPSTGRLLWSEPENHASGEVNSIAFLPDSQRALVARRVDTFTSEAAEASPRLIDAHSGATLSVLGSRVSPLSISGDGSFAAAGSSPVYLWRLSDLTPTQKLSRPSTDSLYPLALMRDGSRVFARPAVNVSSILELEVASGKTLATFNAQRGPVSALALSADDQLLLSGQSNGTVGLWDTRSGRELTTLGARRAGIWRLFAPADGQHVLSLGIDGSVQVWSHDGRLKQAVELPGALALSPRGDLVLLVQPTRLVCWALSSGALVWERALSSAPMPSVDWSARDQILLGSGNDLTELDAKNGAELHRYAITGGVRNARYSDDGARILWASSEGPLEILDAQNGEPTRTFAGHRGPVMVMPTAFYGPWKLGLNHSIIADLLAWSPNGERVASATYREVKVWNVRSGALLWSRSMTSARSPLALAFSPDGRRLLVADANGALRLHDATSGTVQARFELRKGGARGLESSVSALTFLRDGKHMLVGTRGGSLFQLELSGAQ